MTTHRATLTRCARCERAAYSCAPLVVTEQVELGTVEVAHAMLCQRCRSELKDVLRVALRGERP